MEVSDPALCRAKPKLLFRDELVALASGVHADSVDFRLLPNNWNRSASRIRGKGLLPFGPAFTHLNVYLQFT